MRQSFRISDLLPFKRVLALSSALTAFTSPASFAINTDSPLVDILVDAASGEFSSGEAQALLGQFNRYDLSAYTLQFSNGAPLSLGLTPEELDRALLAREQSGADLTAITGPNGTLQFGPDDVTCGSLTPNFEADALGAVRSCLGERLYAASETALVGSALAQVNTVDMLINRPTSNMMVQIRRFVKKKWDYATDQQQPAGGGAGDGEQSALNGPWGFYFQGGGSFANLNAVPGRTGFNMDNQLATAGADYRFSDAIVAGFMFNYTGSGTTLDRNVARLNSDIYRFMPFVSLTPFENAYVDILAGYSYHSYSSRRTAAGTHATADYSADQALASINLGYTVPVGSLEITPYAGGAYMHSSVNGYTEQGSGSQLQVGGYTVSSWTSTVGLQLDYAYSAAFGVLQPHLRLEWLHEFDNNRRGVSVFVPSQGLLVSLPAAEPVRDWGNVSAGVQAVLPNGVMGFVNYQAQIMSAGENHMVEGGVRLEF